MIDDKKRNGGDERERRRSKELMMLSGTLCMKLDLYFRKSNVLTLSADFENISDYNDLSFEIHPIFPS